MITYLGLAHIRPYGFDLDRLDGLGGGGMVTYLGLAYILPIQVGWVEKHCQVNATDLKKHDIYPGPDNPRPPHTLKDNAYPSLSQSMHNTHASTQGPKQCQQQRQDKASNTHAAHDHKHRHTTKEKTQKKSLFQRTLQ